MDKKTRRQESLMRHLEQYRYISLEEIATRFSVTTQTARRDIQELEMAGKVRRLHGGATISHPIDPGVLLARRVLRQVAGVACPPLACICLCVAAALRRVSCRHLRSLAPVCALRAARSPMGTSRVRVAAPGAAPPAAAMR